MRKLFLHVLAGTLGLGLSIWLLKIDFDFKNGYLALIWAGVALGTVNFFIKPILNVLTIPLRIITLGLFSLLLNVAIIWGIDVLMLGKIFTLLNLLWVTLILWILNLILIKNE